MSSVLLRALQEQLEAAERDYKKSEDTYKRMGESEQELVNQINAIKSDKLLDETSRGIAVTELTMQRSDLRKAMELEDESMVIASRHSDDMRKKISAEKRRIEKETIEQLKQGKSAPTPIAPPTVPRSVPQPAPSSNNPQPPPEPVRAPVSVRNVLFPTPSAVPPSRVPAPLVPGPVQTIAPPPPSPPAPPAPIIVEKVAPSGAYKSKPYAERTKSHHYREVELVEGTPPPAKRVKDKDCKVEVVKRRGKDQPLKRSKQSGRFCRTNEAYRPVYWHLKNGAVRYRPYSREGNTYKMYPIHDGPPFDKKIVPPALQVSTPAVQSSDVQNVP